VRCVQLVSTGLIVDRFLPKFIIAVHSSELNVRRKVDTANFIQSVLKQSELMMLPLMLK
jgi:hypothetical protein